MDERTRAIQADFDRIARLTADTDSIGRHGRSLLAQVPVPCRRALEIGCGAGAFSRQLAARAGQVVAIDLSPVMIERARARSQGSPNIDYVVADATRWDFPAGLDLVASIATLHHLPFERTLERLARALRPGGVLLVHDLFRDEGLVDHALAVIGLALSLPRWTRTSPELRAAWAAHAEHDHFLTVREIRRKAAALLPGARVHRHLDWRYTLVWRRPSEN